MAAGMCGAVAQLGERLTGSQEVDGSIPFSSTISYKQLRRPPCEGNGRGGTTRRPQAIQAFQHDANRLLGAVTPPSLAGDLADAGFHLGLLRRRALLV